MDRKVRFIGDIHGCKRMKSTLYPGSIQLGDFDLYGYDGFSFEDGKRYFIDGNHDAHDKLNHDLMELQEVSKNLFYIPRGYVSGKVLFIGGADSIDKKSRSAGYSWWPEECLSSSQFDRIMNIDKKIEVIISHECPEFVFCKLKSIYKARCFHFRMGLDKIFEKFHPSLWIFSHHHQSFREVINDCRFICVDENLTIEMRVPIDRDIIV